MARCGCGDSSANAVRSVLSARDGVNYNPATGVFTANISTVPGNNLTLDGTGALYVPAGSATVTVGPGLTGDGSGGNPLGPKVSAWPYPTAPGTNAQGVFIDPATGNLISPPAQMVDYVTTSFARTYPNNPVSPGGVPVPADTFSVPLANPDPNRSCVAIVWHEVEVRFFMPGTGTTGPSAVGYGYLGDEVLKLDNHAFNNLADIAVQTSKSLKLANLPPSGTSTYNFVVGTSNGFGGSTYNRIEVTARVLYISI